MACIGVHLGEISCVLGKTLERSRNGRPQSGDKPSPDIFVDKSFKYQIYMKLNNKKCAEFAQALRHAEKTRIRIGRRSVLVELQPTYIAGVFYANTKDITRLVRRWVNPEVSKAIAYNDHVNVMIKGKDLNVSKVTLCALDVMWAPSTWDYVASL